MIKLTQEEKNICLIALGLFLIFQKKELFLEISPLY